MIYRTFLGFDCAYVSFAWTYCDINIDIIADISAIYQQINYLNNKYHSSLYEGLCGEHIDEYTEIINRLYMLLANFIRIREIAVVDLLKGKKVANVSEMERALALKKFLVDRQWDSMLADNSIVCIEHQPPKLSNKINSVSPAVGFQLAFYFCDKYQTVYIDPKLKGNLSVSQKLTLAAVAGRKAKYIDRKKHIKLNLIEFAKLFNFDISNIDTRRLADAGDSLFTILAAIAYKKVNLTL